MNVQKDGKCIARPPGGPAFSSSIRSYLSVKHLLTPRANQWSKLFGIGFSTYRKESNASAKKLWLWLAHLPPFFAAFFGAIVEGSNLLQLLQRHSNVLQVNRLTFQCSFRKRGTKRKKWNFRSEEEKSENSILRQESSASLSSYMHLLKRMMRLMRAYQNYCGLFWKLVAV